MISPTGARVTVPEKHESEMMVSCTSFGSPENSSRNSSSTIKLVAQSYGQRASSYLGSSPLCRPRTSHVKN